MDRGTDPRAEEERLLAALERLHRRAMGISMPVYGRARLAPLPFASIWAGAYILAAAAMLGLESSGARSDPRFVGLVGWGLVYSTAVMFFARLATLRSFDIVRRDILPYATPAYVAAVADDLERRDSALMRWVVPLLVAILAALASTMALAHECPPISNARFASTVAQACEIQPIASDRSGPVRLFWTFMGLYLSFVAARGVLVGRFYEPFARRLDLARETFYVLGAAETPLVRGAAGLARQMLILWAMIFLAILSIMLLGAEFVRPYGFQGRSPFLWFVVPAAGFASVGYGSLLYLRSESAIRATLGRFATAQAEALQRLANARLDPAAGKLPEDSDEAEQLSAWHDRILAGARYGNGLGTVLSYTLPFVMPLLALIGAVVGRK
ncbi:MAG TPA: hypothetical protein VEX35_04670 [Allosphingosinicella sp.]|nr:hypothetical protein [Allosphingosinicella sp.]